MQRTGWWIQNLVATLLQWRTDGCVICCSTDMGRCQGTQQQTLEQLKKRTRKGKEMLRQLYNESQGQTWRPFAMGTDS